MAFLQESHILTRHARPRAGHPRLRRQQEQDVDGRDIGERSDAVLRTAMPGHDGVDGPTTTDIWPSPVETRGVRRAPQGDGLAHPAAASLSARMATFFIFIFAPIPRPALPPVIRSGSPA